MLRLLLLLLALPTLAACHSGQAWRPLETSYVRFEIDTTTLYSIEGRYAVARMRAATRPYPPGTWHGQDKVWQFDFDCYLMQWRETDHSRYATNGAIGWFSLNHNLLKMSSHVWRRLGEEHGAVPFSYVCQKAGLIDENGDFTGDYHLVNRPDTVVGR